MPDGHQKAVRRHAIRLMSEARALLAEQAADHYTRIGLIASPEERKRYVDGYEGNDAAVASTAVLLATLGGGAK